MRYLDRVRGLAEVEWAEPLEHFKGVSYRVVVRSRSSGSGQASGYSVFQIVLAHERPDQSILLFESLREEGVRKKWESTARAFGLIALEVDADGKVIARENVDLDKSVKELAREDKLSIDGQLIDRVPPAFVLSEHGERLEIRGVESRVNWLVLSLIIVLGGVLAGVGFLSAAPVLLAWVGLLVMLLVGACGVLMANSRPRVVITRERVELFVDHPLGASTLGTFHTHEIEGIELGRVGAEYGSGLVFRSDTHTVQFDQNLSEDELAWLRNRILAQICTYSDPDEGGS